MWRSEAAGKDLIAGGRGVSRGEDLDEHILGDRWPQTDGRLEMLEEAGEVMRALWTGEEVSHHGTHHTGADGLHDLAVGLEQHHLLASARGRRRPALRALLGERCLRVAAVESRGV